MGYGEWKSCDEKTPLLKEQAELATLDLSDPHHPRLQAKGDDFDTQSAAHTASNTTLLPRSSSAYSDTHDQLDPNSGPQTEDITPISCGPPLELASWRPRPDPQHYPERPSPLPPTPLNGQHVQTTRHQDVEGPPESPLAMISRVALGDSHV